MQRFDCMSAISEAVVYCHPQHLQHKLLVGHACTDKNKFRDSVDIELQLEATQNSRRKSSPVHHTQVQRQHPSPASDSHAGSQAVGAVRVRPRWCYHSALAVCLGSWQARRMVKGPLAAQPRRHSKPATQSCHTLSSMRHYSTWGADGAQ